jgi:hypothetical protein
MSLAQGAEEVIKVRPMDEKTLRWVTKSYPKGNLWVFDNGKCFDILDTPHTTTSGSFDTDKYRRKSSAASFDLGIFQGQVLLDFFPGARQILFFPAVGYSRGHFDSIACQLLLTSPKNEGLFAGSFSLQSRHIQC